MEIEFRGIDKISGEFVFGDLIHGVGSKNGNIYILPRKINLAYVKNCDPLDGVKVIPETVGQYTGLKDKNGIKIFSGDWIKSAPGYTSYIEFKDGAFMSIYTHPEDGEELLIIDLDLKNVEVIGNIHQNK